jgi:hypothetical protein
MFSLLCPGHIYTKNYTTDIPFKALILSSFNIYYIELDIVNVARIKLTTAFSAGATLKCLLMG